MVESGKMYLSKLPTLFVQIEKCIYPNYQIYLSNFHNVFVQIAKCIASLPTWSCSLLTSGWHCCVKVNFLFLKEKLANASFARFQLVLVFSFFKGTHTQTVIVHKLHFCSSLISCHCIGVGCQYPGLKELNAVKNVSSSEADFFLHILTWVTKISGSLV